MPKCMFIDPSEVKKAGYLRFTDIPINCYHATEIEEKEKFSPEELRGIFQDMYHIRSFEQMLHEIKYHGAYKDIRYQYSGPLHLSIGQEAAAVGQAFLLEPEDFVFGSHRSHGEILAKGFSAIRKLSDTELYRVMEDYDEGAILKIIEDKQHNVRELAEDFLLYGVAAEIFARKTGFQKGLCGSMHVFFPPFGMYPNNAIVGASASIAVGAALYKKVNRQPGIVISNLGDGALGRGPVWEAMMFSAMDQFQYLWEEGYQGGLPIIFNFFNNFYGMGGQTVGETMPFGILARIGAGIHPNQLHAERVNGSNPLAVIDAMNRKTKLLRKNCGPVLLDVITYRTTAHSTSDHESYRTEEELQAWKKQDPLSEYSVKLMRMGLWTQDAINAFQESTDRRMERICRLALDDTKSPTLSQCGNIRSLEPFIYSNQRVPSFSNGIPELLSTKQENPRYLEISCKARFGLDANGVPKPKTETYTVSDALFESILDKFSQDASLIAYGEDVRDWGGPHSVYRGLTEALPYHRFFNSPISEAAIVASAAGYAMCGGRAIVELMYCDFLGCAGDEIFNQLSKWQFMSAGKLHLPVVLRISIGSIYGTQHAQDFTAMVAHVPGLKIVFPATPYDAKGLMTAALNGTDPVLFFESQKTYDLGEYFHLEGVPKNPYEIEIGQPDVKLPGTDLTIFTVGSALYTAWEAAKQLKKQYGISAELIDARSLVPLDYTLLLESVQKTGKLLLISDAVERGSFLKDVAANITELAFASLKAPPVVLGARNWIAPTSEVSSYYYSSPEMVLDLIHQKFYPLPGYQPKFDFSNQEKLRRSSNGV